ncbi:hypothetical protein [Acidovorax sp. SDU_ACID1]|uniref:hypothetical protein n=1 Tax=Acidovorax sp. SDU_ACID1 TaxID=3136632 RepID=UPI003873085D
MKKYLCLITLYAGCSIAAHADLKNVSATTLQSNTTEAIACTIIATGGPTYQGYKVLVAFSETNGGGNPTARVSNFNRTINYTNDNWTEHPMYLNGEAIGTAEQLRPFYINGVGRTPQSATDSAMLVLFPPGEAACMYSTEVSSGNLTRTSLAMTDITSSIAGAKSLSAQEVSILERLMHRD